MEFHRGRNGLLGFGINEVGVVQKVDGLAKSIGLQTNSRLLQVCVWADYMYMYGVKNIVLVLVPPPSLLHPILSPPLSPASLPLLLLFSLFLSPSTPLSYRWRTGCSVAIPTLKSWNSSQLEPNSLLRPTLCLHHQTSAGRPSALLLMICS